MSEKNSGHDWKRIVLIALLIALSINGVIFLAKFIGFVSYQEAKAGYITEIDVKYQEPAYAWSGLYGVSLPAEGYNNLQSAVLESAGMLENNLIFPCFPDKDNKYVFTTMRSKEEIDWANVQAASATDVDAFLGYNGNELDSATKTFTDIMIINFGGTQIPAPAVYTNVFGMTGEKIFGLAVLKDIDDNLIFVNKIGDFEKGFNGRTYNYQMILPIYNRTDKEYFFYANPTDLECPSGLGVVGDIGYVAGYVTDNNGNPLTDVTVGIAEYRFTVTNPTGYFNITAPAGNYSLNQTIAAYKETYETHFGTVMVYIGNTTSYDIIMNKLNVNVGPGQTDFTNVDVGPGKSQNTKTNDGEGPGIGPGIGPYLEAPKRIEGQDFIVSIPQINRRLKIDNFLEEIVAIYSFKNEPVTLEFSIEGSVKDLIELETDRMVIQPNSNANLKLRAFGRGPLGVYNGTLKIMGSVNQEIPIRIELTDKDLLDIQTLFIDLEVIDEKINPGQTLRYRTTLRNLLTDTEYPVNLFFVITDSKGNLTVSASSDNINLRTTFSILKSQKLPKNLPPGDYIITVQANYLDLSSTVSGAFKVTLPFYKYMLFGKIPLWWIFLAIAVILLLFGIGYAYYKNVQSKKKYHLKVEYAELPKPGPRNVYVGKISETDHKAYFNLENFKVHTIVAGSTGGGKSFSAQGIIEEMLLHNVAVIVFDPTAQWTGFLRKMQSKSLLALYSAFGMKPTEARAFNGNIRMIKNARELIDIKKYMKPGEIQVFACHKLDPKDMDVYVSNTIKEVFHGNFNESPELRLMIVFDEIHRILPKFGGSGAGFLQIERGCREFRKWGIGIMLISQVLGDFMGEIKANINTEIQMRTRDEGDLDRIATKYGKEVLQSLVKATVGSGMVENPAYNRGRPYFISFKPLMHSVERLSDEDIEKYNKYNELIDQLEFELKQLEEDNGQDVFDLKLELKLALDKVKSGNFNMVDIYVDGLKPRIEKLWEKIGKTPKKYQIKLASDEELEAELKKAKNERVKAEAEAKKNAPMSEQAENKPKEKTTLELRTGFTEAFTFPNGQQVTNIQEMFDVLPSIIPPDFAKVASKEKNSLADWVKNKLGAPEFSEKIRPIIDRDELISAVDREMKKPGKVKDEAKPKEAPAQNVQPQPFQQPQTSIPIQSAQQTSAQSQPAQTQPAQKVNSWQKIKAKYEMFLTGREKINYLLDEEKAYPAEPNIKYALGIEYHKIKDYQNAQAKYLETLKLIPNNPKVINYLNIVQQAMIATPSQPQNAHIQAENAQGSIILPPEKYFRLSDGRQLKSYNDLKSAVHEMKDDEIKNYVNETKNDFANWVEGALENKTMAEKLRHAHSKSELEEALS